MLRAAALVGLLVTASTVQAQSLTAIAGHPVKLYTGYSTNPDCTSEGDLQVRVTQAPQHGRITVKTAGVFPNFPASNVRSACNRRRVPGVLVHYVSERGYSGFDQLGFQVIFPNGASRTFSGSVTVQP